MHLDRNSSSFDRISGSLQDNSTNANASLIKKDELFLTDTKEVKKQLQNASLNSDQSINFKVFKKLSSNIGVKHAVSFCIGHKLMSIGQKLQGTTVGSIIDKFFKYVNKKAVAVITNNNLSNSSIVEKKYQSLQKQLSENLGKTFPDVDKEHLSKAFKKYVIKERAFDVNHSKNNEALIESLLSGFKDTKKDLLQYLTLIKELKDYKSDPKIEKLVSKEMMSDLKKQLSNDNIKILPFLLEKSFKKYLSENPKIDTKQVISEFCKNKKNELALLSEFHESSEMEKTGERMILKSEQAIKDITSQSSRQTKTVNLEEQKLELEKRKESTSLGIDKFNENKKQEYTAPNLKKISIRDSDLGIED